MTNVAAAARTPSGVRHALTLGTVDTDCVLLGCAGDAPSVRSRLDSVGRDALPAALARALDPVLEGRDGVVRINRVQAEFDLRRGDLDSGELLRRWADRLARSLCAELDREHAGNVARFDDHADFAAAYLELRFGEARHPVWAFGDFHAMDLLAPEHAALELLRARPGYLLAVARRADVRGRVDDLAGRLSPRAILELLDSHAEPQAIARRVHALRSLAARHAAQLAAGKWRPWTGARRSLALALRMLARVESSDVVSALMLARVAGALSHLLETLADAGPAAVTHPERVRGALQAGRGGGGRDEVAAVLSPLLDQAEGRVLLRELAAPLQATPAARDGQQDSTGRTRSHEADVDNAVEHRRRQHDEVADTESARPEPATRRAARADDERVLLSAVAGVTLTLTTVRRLDLHRALPPPRLWDTLVALLADDRRAGVHRDPLLGLLAPFDPRERDGEWPVMDAALLQPLAESARVSIAGLADEYAWARLLATRFAATLPGLAGSSNDYLRRQFLHASGSVRMTASALHVTLEAVPLAVVLRMAGMTGWQGRLPWLADRELHIDIRE